MLLSARIERTWNRTMVLFGYEEFCDSTVVENGDIHYNYTSDASAACRHCGEELWVILFYTFGLDNPGIDAVHKYPQPMCVVSRKLRLWTK